MSAFLFDFLKSIKSGFKRYFQFSGESTRKEFAHWLLLYFLVIFVVPELLILIMIPMITVAIRRMRAVGRTFWWIFFFPLLIYFGLRKESTEKAEPTVEIVKVSTAAISDELKTIDDAISAFRSINERLSVSDESELDSEQTQIVTAGIKLLSLSGLGGDSSVTKSNKVEFKAVMWSGIVLGVVCDESGNVEIAGSSTVSAIDLLRKAISGFDSIGDSKMAGRASEELGQLGRLLSNSDVQSEGFEGAIQRFRTAGDDGRLQQAVKNSGENFLRMSSSFFDGSKPSLRCTTILGSKQALRIRDQLG
jgi:uncharacterized membrane protein YhaH (DUF805 family)